MIIVYSRGHALSAQLEGSGPGAAPGSPGLMSLESPRSPPVSFEQFSKDEAFKMSQKGAGLSYTDKVQSYLQQEQHYMANGKEAVAGPDGHGTDQQAKPAHQVWSLSSSFIVTRQLLRKN